MDEDLPDLERVVQALACSLEKEDPDARPSQPNRASRIRRRLLRTLSPFCAARERGLAAVAAVHNRLLCRAATMPVR